MQLRGNLHVWQNHFFYKNAIFNISIIQENHQKINVSRKVYEFVCNYSDVLM